MTRDFDSARAAGQLSDGAGVLRVAAVVPDTEAEGPGRRFAVWLQGCPLRCPGCCNPEMLSFRGGETRVPRELAAAACAVPALEGVTLLGGEPFAQAEAAAVFAEIVRAAGLSVMVFSGYTLAELRAFPQAAALLASCDLLVDGRYDRTRPEPPGGRRWIGSANQVMHRLSARYAADDPRFTTGNTVELRLSAAERSLTVNGWPAAASAVRAPRRA
ncbi:MAG TPA: 4Fe-4S single cluster domain-containing protein [Polyangia bacterium]|jgi:anaerobic ribonucleoside-triphosphate reductase activating protein|nr:4Fe-4S single cluster domain-containing protein [Polyangia bacterium]